MHRSDKEERDTKRPRDRYETLRTIILQASKRRKRRLGLLALTVGPLHSRMRASKKRASEGSVCGCAMRRMLHGRVRGFASRGPAQAAKRPLRMFGTVELFILLQLKRGGVAKAKGEGEKEKECTTECKSRRR